MRDQQQGLAELRERLQHAVAQQRLTKTQLVQRTGLGRTTIYEALSDHKPPPSPTTVAALAHTLALDAAPLLKLLRPTTPGERPSHGAGTATRR